MKIESHTRKKRFYIILTALSLTVLMAFTGACSVNNRKSGYDRVALTSELPSDDLKSPADATFTDGGVVSTAGSETPELTPSDAPESTATPTEVPTEVPTLPPTDTPSPSPLPTDTPTPVPTDTPVPTATLTPVPTQPAPTATPVVTPTPVRPTVPDATPYATPDDGSTFDIVISMVGDCMLASYKNEDAENGFKEYANREDPKYFLEKVAPIFKSDDLTIANLECVLTDRDLPPVEKSGDPVYWYYGKTANTRILTEQGVEAVSLANNHLGDYGEEGRLDTVKAVSDAGLLYAGWSETFYYEKNGYKIAVICANMYSTSGGNAIVELVKQESQRSDFQIVFFHGGKMKIHEPEEWKINVAHKIVDAGADLIVGAHPHMLQPREIYNGVDIVYSLGNFCYGGSRRPENRTIIYQTTLTVNIEDGKLISKNSELIPCYVYTASVNNFQPAPITDPEEYRRVIDFMNWQTDSPL